MTNVETLARDWLEAKAEEEEARAKRIAIEDQITAALETKTEGSITHTVGNYKVTLTQTLNRKLLLDTWDRVKANCPIAMQPVKVRLEADPTGCKWIAANEPQIWASIAEAFEVKPTKIGVKIVAK